MNKLERVNLQKLITENGVVDQTDNIRSCKHSDGIRENVLSFLSIDKKYKRLRETNKKEFDRICMSKCSFLFNTYTNIYNRMYSNTLDISVLMKFLDILKEIEDGKVDQHEGSFKAGTLLKTLYIDSALKETDKRDKKRKKKKGYRNRNVGDNTMQNTKSVNEHANLSWADYKKLHKKRSK